jgi:hypothetical protein
MGRPPIPQRLPPLKWRAPSFLWTPLGLAAAIGWPALLFYENGNLLRVVLAAGAVMFVLALVTLGVSWGLGRAPRTRRTVVAHVLVATIAVAVAAPLLLHTALGDAALALTPLALIVGLPLALVSGTLFSILALDRVRPPSALFEDGLYRPHDVQPFR